MLFSFTRGVLPIVSSMLSYTIIVHLVIIVNAFRKIVKCDRYKILSFKTRDLSGRLKTPKNPKRVFFWVKTIKNPDFRRGLKTVRSGFCRNRRRLRSRLSFGDFLHHLALTFFGNIVKQHGNNARDKTHDARQHEHKPHFVKAVRSH